MNKDWISYVLGWKFEGDKLVEKISQEGIIWYKIPLLVDKKHNWRHPAFDEGIDEILISSFVNYDGDGIVPTKIEIKNHITETTRYTTKSFDLDKFIANYWENQALEIALFLMYLKTCYSHNA